MNWHNIGKAVGGIAPHLGAALGGPFGAIVGGAVGKAFGVNDPDPDKLAEALKNDSEAEQKLAELEALYRDHVAALDAQSNDNTIDQVNETIRAELKAEHWVQYSWRPFIGFTTGLSFLIVTVFCAYLGFDAISKGSHESLNMISDMIFSYSALFAIPGSVLGLASWQRGYSGKDGPQPLDIISDNLPVRKKGSFMKIFKRRDNA